MTDRISTDELRKLLAKSEAGYTYAGIDLENIAPDLAAEVIRLRGLLRSILDVDACIGTTSTVHDIARAALNHKETNDE